MSNEPNKRRVTVRNAAGEVVESRQYHSAAFAAEEYERQLDHNRTKLIRAGWTVELGS